MARTTKKYGGVNYIADDDFDYTTAIGEAASHGDYDYAASLERSRNAKIDGEGLSYAKTYKYQNGTSPVYKSKYGGKIDKTLSAIMNRKPFEYDYTKDDSYKALEAVYKANGKYAMQDTLGDAAALTGGKASTAAISASQQSYNRYMSELAANIPALEQAAYGRYRDEEASLYDQLGLLQGMDKSEYGRWSNAWERDHMLGREAVEDARYDDEIAYRDKRDAVADVRYDDEIAYRDKRDAVADARYDDEIAYRDERDAIEDARYNDEVTYERDMDTIDRLMSIASETGDYSVIRDYPELADKYGFSEEVVAALNKAHAEGVAEKDTAQAFAMAQYMAQYGDFSYFKKAGFTDEQISKMEEYWKTGELREGALFAAQFGDYSALRAMGINPQVQSEDRFGGFSYSIPSQSVVSSSSFGGTGKSSSDTKGVDADDEAGGSEEVSQSHGDVGEKSDVGYPTEEMSDSDAVEEAGDVAAGAEGMRESDTVEADDEADAAKDYTVEEPVELYGDMWYGDDINSYYGPGNPGGSDEDDYVPFRFDPVGDDEDEAAVEGGSGKTGDRKKGEISDLPQAAVEGMEFREILGSILANDGYKAAKAALDDAKRTGAIDPAQYRSLLTWLQIQDMK